MMIAPSGGHAATVSFDLGADPSRGTDNPAFLYEAGSNERSDLRVSRSRGRYTFRTVGNGVRAGHGCVQHGAHRVVCHDQPQAAVTVSLGRRNDRADVRVDKSNVRIVVFGGAGNDRLSVHAPRNVNDVQIYGGAGNDVIDGSNGNDTLDGGGSSAGSRGAGNDVIRGGRGNDTITDGDLLSAPRGDHDTIDGGPGRDKLDLSKRTRSVTIDLAAGRGGGTGEHDRIRGIEDVTSGDGNDTLIGNAAANDLSGGDKGRDTAIGGAGNDTLDATRVDGGAGNDHIRAAAAATCGSGADTVADDSLSQPTAALANDCELVSIGGWLDATAYPTMLAADGRGTFRIACRRSDRMCIGNLAVGGSSTAFSIAPGTSAAVPIALGPGEAAALSSPSGLRTDVVVTPAPGTPEATPGVDQVTGARWTDVLRPMP
jgi:hypothetical protein